MYLKIATAIFVVLASAFGWHALTRNHYESVLADANKQIGALTTSNSAMKASVEKQNGAISDLQADAKRRERDASQAVKQAQQRSAKEQTRAQAVLLLRPPLGVNPCAAAEAAFDDELRTERGDR